MEDDMRTPPSKAEVKREKADYQKRGATSKKPLMTERMEKKKPMRMGKMTDKFAKGRTKKKR